ncbi:MAG TPA: peptidoglycan-binding domain-containing protein [Rhizomicrobium sp.]|nr:peptidoglycan-binding domain-containing protein [Rhizomicrobium sp.]
MTRRRRAAVLLGILALTMLATACSQPTKTPEPSIAAPVAPQVPVSQVPVPRSVLDQDMVTDQREILATQRALSELGYNTGKADGVNGPATRRAIRAFQKDNGLAEDGRLTLALAKMVNILVARLPKSMSISVAAGDSIIFDDGSVDSAGRERVVQWGQEGHRAVLAVRPSTAGWPPAARAGLEWATTHALDEGGGVPIQWSSTGVLQHFEIHVFPALSHHEAAVAGAGQLCRHFELRGGDPVRRFPGLACKDAEGNWYLPHTRIRLARPATTLESPSDNGDVLSDSRYQQPPTVH